MIRLLKTIAAWLLSAVFMLMFWCCGHASKVPPYNKNRSGEPTEKREEN